MVEKKKETPEADKPKTLAIKVPGYKARETHKVYKNQKGDVMVDHTQRKGGKYDKINLTKKAGAKTVKQGVAAVKKWHSPKTGGR